MTGAAPGEVPAVVAWPVGIALAAVFGSFLNVCISRLPCGDSIVLPASRCPRCQTPIQYCDNIPLVSFLLLGGRCRTCRAPISWRYPLVEAVTIAVGALILWQLGPTWAGGRAFFFGLALITVTFTDFETRLIPNWVTLPGIVFGLALDPTGPARPGMGAVLGALILVAIRFWQGGRLGPASDKTPSPVGGTAEPPPDPAQDRQFALQEAAVWGAILGRQLAAFDVSWAELSHPGRDLVGHLARQIDPLVAGCLLAGGLLYLIAMLSPLVFGQEGMGGGDIKLAAMMGAFLGVQGVLVGLFLGVIGGGAAAILLLVLGLRRFGEYLSFGPFLAVGALMAALWGQDLLRSYLAFMDWYLG